MNKLTIKDTCLRFIYSAALGGRWKESGYEKGRIVSCDYVKDKFFYTGSHWEIVVLERNIFGGIMTYRIFLSVTGEQEYRVSKYV